MKKFPGIRGLGDAAVKLGKTPWVDRHMADILPKLRGEVRASWLPRMSANESQVEEYGCGAFGCVMPTGRAGLVVKLTTDVSEAWFVARAMVLGQQPGIVEYKKIFVSETPLDPGFGVKYRIHPTRQAARIVGEILTWANRVSETSGDVRAPRITMEVGQNEAGHVVWQMPPLQELSDWLAWADPKFHQDDVEFHQNMLLERIAALARIDLMFILWRTEARSVGNWKRELVDRFPFGTQVTRATSILKSYKLACAEVYEFLGRELTRTDVAGRRKLLTAAWDIYEHGVDDGEGLGESLRACWRSANKMRDDPLLADVGRALVFYMERGLLLGDLHSGNFGFPLDGGDKLIITDPGVVIEFHPRWAQPPQVPIL